MASQGCPSTPVFPGGLTNRGQERHMWLTQDKGEQKGCRQPWVCPRWPNLFPSGQMKARGRDKSSSFIQTVLREAYLPQSPSAFWKRSFVLSSLEWSVTCPTAHYTFKQTISELQTCTTYLLSSTSSEEQKCSGETASPLRLPGSHHQHCVDIWTVAGPVCSGKMAKSHLWELFLNNAIFLPHLSLLKESMHIK